MKKCYIFFHIFFTEKLFYCSDGKNVLLPLVYVTGFRITLSFRSTHADTYPNENLKIKKRIQIDQPQQKQVCLSILNIVHFVQVLGLSPRSFFNQQQGGFPQRLTILRMCVARVTGGGGHCVSKQSNLCNFSIVVTVQPDINPVER